MARSSPGWIKTCRLCSRPNCEPQSDRHAAPRLQRFGHAPHGRTRIQRGYGQTGTARKTLCRSHERLSGDSAKAKAANQDFLTLWKDADPDIPILKEAKGEYAKLQ